MQNRWLLALLLLIILIFDLSTIRRGQHWGDDYALYIHHAENIAQHRPYAETGYIYDSNIADYGPRMYPPVFPLLLVPIFKSFGMNFTAMKVEEILFLVASLWIEYLLFREYLPQSYTLFLVAITGLNPVLWDLKDDILSDFPFLFFFMLSALLFQKRSHPILVGLVFYIAMGTRSVGIVLIVAVIVYDVLRNRTLTRYSGIVISVALAALMWQRLLLHGDASTSYTEQLHPTIHSIGSHVFTYVISMRHLFASPSKWLSRAIMIIFTPVVILGMKRKQPVFFSLSLLLYCFALIIWPSIQLMRFLIPLVPIYFFYLVGGIEQLGRRALIPAAIIIVIAYAVDYRTENFAEIPEANGSKTFVDMYSYVKGNTSPSDKIVFSRARSLALFSDRSVATYHLADPDSEWKYWTQNNFHYVVASRLFPMDSQILVPALHGHNAKVVYSNPDFEVYSIQ